MNDPRGVDDDQFPEVTRVAAVRDHNGAFFASVRAAAPVTPHAGESGDKLSRTVGTSSLTVGCA